MTVHNTPEETPVVTTRKNTAHIRNWMRTRKLVTTVRFNKRKNPADDSYVITYTNTRFEDAKETGRKKKRVVAPFDLDEIRIEGSTIIHKFGIGGPENRISECRLNNEVIAETYKQAYDNAVADGFLNPQEEEVLNALRIEIGTTMKNVVVTDEQLDRIADIAGKIPTALAKTSLSK